MGRSILADAGGPGVESSRLPMFDSTTPARLYRNRVYLLHFYNPVTLETARLAHAGHYCGSSEDVSARLAEHGTPRGAKLTLAVRRAGLSWFVAKTWVGGRRKERLLKSRKNAPRELCPICRGEIDLVAVIESQGRNRAGGRVIGKRTPMEDIRRVAFYERMNAGKTISGKD